MTSIVLVQNSRSFVHRKFVCRQGKFCVGRFQEEICTTWLGGIICTPEWKLHQQAQTHTDTDTQGHTDTDTHAHTHTHTHTHTKKQT